MSTVLVLENTRSPNSSRLCLCFSCCL